MRNALVMDQEAFFAWAEAQPRGRYERIGREVIATPPEQWRHARLKAAIWRALDDQVRSLPQCSVAPDGMTVTIDDGADFQPDVSVHVGDPIPEDSLVVPNPVIVIEVISPSSQRIDTVIKREGYFRVPSVAHYLVFRADRREVLHWRREAEAPEQHFGGRLLVTRPGLTLDLDGIYDWAETS